MLERRGAPRPPLSIFGAVFKCGSETLAFDTSLCPFHPQEVRSQLRVHQVQVRSVQARLRDGVHAPSAGTSHTIFAKLEDLAAADVNPRDDSPSYFQQLNSEIVP